MQAIIQQHIKDLKPIFNISFVFSSNLDAQGLTLAKKYNIPTYAFEKSSYSNKDEYENKILDLCKKYSIKYILCAGYMKIIGTVLLKQYQDCILNIHPSLLPSFKGLNAQQQAINYGVKYTGCTVHLVNEKVDAGKILDQSVITILKDDDNHSLSKRLLKKEHAIYYKAVKEYITIKEVKIITFYTSLLLI